MRDILANMNMQDLKIRLSRVAYLGAEKRADLYQSLAAFLEDGLSVYQSMSMMRDRFQSRRDPQSWMFSHMLEIQGQGKGLGDAMRGLVPASELALIDAGERSGALKESLTEAAFMADSARRIRSQLIGALTYPSVLFLMGLGVLVAFGKFMVPQFSKISDPETWTGAAGLMYGLSSGLVAYWPYLLSGLTALIALIGWSLNNWIHPVRERAFNRIPPWSFHRTSQSSSFLIALAAMIQSGIPFGTALTRMRGLAAPWLRWHIGRMVRRMGTGAAYGDVLDCTLFDAKTADQIAIYGQLSSFDDAVKALGRRAVDEGVKRINAMAQAVRYLMMAVLGLTIGGLFFAVYSLSSSIQGMSGTG